MEYFQHCFLAHLSLVLILTVPRIHSVVITCNSNLRFQNMCPVEVDFPYANITRISAEDSRYNCIKDKNFGYLYYGPQLTYVWVLLGCGGTFSVTAPSPRGAWGAWGAWGSCSVTCGIGIRIRTRTCSTGKNTDCSSNAKVNSELRWCVGDCSKIVSWKSWGAWGPCSATCGVGIKSRIRACSTGNNTDCSSLANANTMSTICRTQECSTDTGNGTTMPFCGKAASKSYRVIGGTGAQNCQYPWMVMVYNRRRTTACGGSIIDSTHILTAAHCVSSKTQIDILQDSPSDLRILSGSSAMPFRRRINSIPGIRIRAVSGVKIHKDYNFHFVDNDIAILTLKTPIRFDRCHIPVCLPGMQQSALGVLGCKVMGWGKTKNSQNGKVSSDLLYTDIKVLKQYRCYLYYPRSYNASIKICAGGSGQGSCSGDSGGPLICPGNENRYYQYGIVSTGTKNLCGIRPGVYTKVSSFLPWIHANTK